MVTNCLNRAKAWVYYPFGDETWTGPVFCGSHSGQVLRRICIRLFAVKFHESLFAFLLTVQLSAWRFVRQHHGSQDQVGGADLQGKMPDDRITVVLACGQAAGRPGPCVMVQRTVPGTL